MLQGQFDDFDRDTKPLDNSFVLTLAILGSVRIPPVSPTLPPLLGDVTYPTGANTLFSDTQEVLHSPDFL
jgi:hypothetical protein